MLSYLSEVDTYTYAKRIVAIYKFQKSSLSEKEHHVGRVTKNIKQTISLTISWTACLPRMGAIRTSTLVLEHQRQTKEDKGAE